LHEPAASNGAACKQNAGSKGTAGGQQAGGKSGEHAARGLQKCIEETASWQKEGSKQAAWGLHASRQGFAAQAPTFSNRVHTGLLVRTPGRSVFVTLCASLLAMRVHVQSLIAEGLDTAPHLHSMHNGTRLPDPPLAEDVPHRCALPFFCLPPPASKETQHACKRGVI